MTAEVPETSSPTPPSGGFAGRGLIYTLGTAAPALAAVIVLPFLSGTLSRSQFDLASVCNSVIQVGVVLVALGMGAAITREYILNPLGYRGAQGLVLQSAGICLLITGIALATGGMWVPTVLGREFSGAVAWALLACLGGGLVVIEQAYLRGADRPVAFVLLASGGTLFGPLAGVALIAYGDPAATNYLACVAGGYLLAGAIGLMLVLQAGRPVVTWTNLRTALRVGLPTVPHQIALYLSVAGLVVVADRTHSGSGSATIILTLGASTTVMTGAFNNAWAPAVYRAKAEERPALLTTTSRQVYHGVAFLIVLVAAFSPYALAIINRGSVPSKELLVPIAIAAFAALPSVVYLASGHLVFVAARTVPLSITTPFSVGVGIVLAAALADRLDLKAIAIAYLVIYLSLALLTTWVQRSVSETPWLPSLPVVTTASTMALTAVAATIPSGGWWILARALIVVVATGIAAWQFKFRGPATKKQL